jgi:hypothetical protein
MIVAHKPVKEHKAKKMKGKLHDPSTHVRIIVA